MRNLYMSFATLRSK